MTLVGAILPTMKFVENLLAGYGVREFYNLNPPRSMPRPGHLDLGWSYLVRQVGTRQTGRREWGIVFYHQRRRKRRSVGQRANEVLRTVQGHRSNVEPSSTLFSSV